MQSSIRLVDCHCRCDPFVKHCKQTKKTNYCIDIETWPSRCCVVRELWRKSLATIMCRQRSVASFSCDSSHLQWVVRARSLSLVIINIIIDIIINNIIIININHQQNENNADCDTGRRRTTRADGWRDARSSPNATARLENPHSTRQWCARGSLLLLLMFVILRFVDCLCVFALLIVWTARTVHGSTQRYNYNQTKQQQQQQQQHQTKTILQHSAARRRASRCDARISHRIDR
jgi:hypothetical protein